MADHITINILNNRYGVNKEAADFVNDLIYSAFFSSSGAGVYNRMTGWNDYRQMLQNPNDPASIRGLTYTGAGMSPDELLPILQKTAAQLIATGAYSKSVRDAQVSLLLVEDTSKGKAVTWKVVLTPSDTAKLPLISVTITGAAIKKVSKNS